MLCGRYVPAINRKMVFYPPDWMPKLAEPPDTVSLPEFVFENKHDRFPIEKSRPLFTCGLSGRSYSPAESRYRVSALARGLSKEFGWKPNEKSEWDKVACVFAVNTVSQPSLLMSIRFCNSGFSYADRTRLTL